MPTLTTLSRSDYGRGLAGAALVLLAFVTVGSLLSDVPGDRIGAAVFAPIVVLGFYGSVQTRAATRGASPWLRALGIAQGAAGLALIANGIGAPAVVFTLTGLFTGAWLAAAWLLRSKRASTDTHG